jgi:hypothetical protein
MPLPRRPRVGTNYTFDSISASLKACRPAGMARAERGDVLIDRRWLARNLERRARNRNVAAGGEPHHIDGPGVFRRAGIIGSHCADLRGAIPMPEGDVVGACRLEIVVSDEPRRTQPAGSIRHRHIMAVCDRNLPTR